MQLNIYVPKDKQDIVRKLDAAARALGRPKNPGSLLQLLGAGYQRLIPYGAVLRRGQVFQHLRGYLQGAP